MHFTKESEYTCLVRHVCFYWLIIASISLIRLPLSLFVLIEKLHAKIGLKLNGMDCVGLEG